VRQVVATIIALKGVGGLLFVIGNIFGAYLLVRLLLVHLTNKGFKKLAICMIS